MQAAMGQLSIPLRSVSISSERPLDFRLLWVVAAANELRVGATNRLSRLYSFA
jgi:hypothetical protein